MSCTRNNLKEKFKPQKLHRSCNVSRLERKVDDERFPNNLVKEKEEKSACNVDQLEEVKVPISRQSVFSKNTINESKPKAAVVADEELQVPTNVRLLEEERRKAESENRKTELRKYDNLYRTKGPKLAQIDEEAKKKTNYMLNRAFELRQNQEDEIKQCNSLILGTKCLAIRCAQIAEKELIQKEMKQEQRRMEKIMAQNRMIEAIKYKKAMDDERQKKKLQATAIVQQMEENELTRDWEMARNEAEAKIRMEAAIMAQRAEEMDYKEKLKNQAKMRTEFLQINAQLSDMKKTEKELAKIEIQQIQEYTKKKNDREIAFEEEMKKKKLLKEKEIIKIQSKQKASQDLQAARDELNTLRTQDKVEKEWRRKEREEAIKKIKENEELKEARRRQIEDQRESYAYEIQREQEQFDKIIKMNIEDIEKTKALEQQKKMKINNHRQNLIKQIREKELEKIQERKNMFQEGVKYQEEEAARKKMLRNTMLKKVEGLKTLNLPIKYIHGIERQLKLKEEDN